jgi:hypothetical protein
VTVVNDDTTKDGSIEKPHLGGDTLKIRLDYSDYEREDAVFIAIRNDCWEESAGGEPIEYMALMSKRASFTGSGSIELEWTISYNDLFSTKQLDTGGFMCGLFDNLEDAEYGGFLCTDWLTECEKNEWRIYPKLATQPFLEIAPTAPFAMFVNDLDENRGIGIIEPQDQTEAVVGEPFTFKWDANGFTHYAGHDAIGDAIPVDNVDIKLYYLTGCIPETFIGCTEEFMQVTEPNVGVPNTGEVTMQFEECTNKGHKLSDAGGKSGIKGSSVYAVVQGIENTNIVSRMSGEFYVQENPDCSKNDITFSFGESFLKVNSGLPGLTGDELQIGVHVVKTWYKDDIERFTDEVLTGGFHSWNASLPFKDVCKESCIKIEVTQGGTMGGSCVIWGGR